MIEAGEVLAVDEVKREVKKKDDDVARWVLARRGLFVPLEHDIQKATKEVLAACPRLMAQHAPTGTPRISSWSASQLPVAARSSPRRPRPTAKEAADPGRLPCRRRSLDDSARLRRRLGLAGQHRLAPHQI